MKKYIIIFFFNSLIYSQVNTSTGYTFLNVGNSGREFALSDFGVVGGEQVSNVYYNPAILTSIKNPQVYFTHNIWISDVSAQTFGANFYLFDFPVSINVNNTAIKDIEIRTKPDGLYSKFDARYFYFGISSALSLSKKISFGLTAKYIYENILSDESSGYAADLGIIYSNALDNLNLGLSIRNLGSVSELRHEKSDLPIDFRFGASYKLHISQIESSVTLLSGIQKNLNVDDIHLHFAVEYSYDDLIFIRTGYLTGYESRGISFGAGFAWGSAELDYSFVPFDFGLGNSNAITLLYNF